MEDQFYQNSTIVVEEIKSHICSIGKWNRFFAILLIISAAIMFISSLFMLTSGTVYYNGVETNSAYLAVIYLILVGCYIPVIVFQFRVASAAEQVYMTENDGQVVAEFLRYSKKYWKYVGVLTIIFLGLTIISVPISIIASVL